MISHVSSIIRQKGELQNGGKKKAKRTIWYFNFDLLFCQFTLPQNISCQMKWVYLLPLSQKCVRKCQTKVKVSYSSEPLKHLVMSDVGKIILYKNDKQNLF